MKKTLRSVCLTTTALMVSFLSLAQSTKTADKSPSKPADEWSQPIPNDPSVKTGTLKNGMKYYIRKNVEPKNRMELRLAIKVGSILETEDQLGLAHFMEHMNFNGTKSFPKNEIVNFLQRSGLKFGADLNASTSFDETIYQLQVPTDSVALFNKAFQVLEEWAHEATLDTAEINKERGVVLEELRLRGKNAQQRIQQQTLPILFNNSLYAKRLPIGTEENLKTFKPESIVRYYKDWYRPDLMAVIVVGDIDVAQVEKIVMERFGSIPSVKNPKTREYASILPHAGTKTVVLTDKEYPQYLVQIYTKLPQHKTRTLGDYRDNIKTSLFNEMLGNRLQELTKKADPPFLGSISQYGGFLGKQDVFQSFALAKNAEGIETAFKALTEENERVLKFGFSDSELERAKTAYLTNVEKAFKEKDKTKSAALVGSLLNNFIDQTPYSSIEFRYEFAQKNVAGITLADINALAPQWIKKDNRDVIVIGPEKDKDKLPKEAQLIEWLNSTGKTLTAYVDDAANKPLLDKLPSGSKVAAEKKVAEVGITEWILGNGVKVVLKPTDFKNDQILVSAQSPGGTSLYTDKDFDNADLSNTLVTESGIADFSATQLEKMMTGKVAQIFPYVGETEEGMSGGCSPKDLETELQLIYAYFTKPRKDPDAIKGFMSTNRDYLKNEQATLTPEKVFGDTITTVLDNYAARSLPMTVERWEKINPNRAFDIYKERFADASDFTFFLVGSFDTEKIKSLIEQYLGALPSINRKESFKDLGIREPKGMISKTVYKGLEDKSSVRLHFSGDYIYTPQNDTQLDAIIEILQIKLTEKLREEESGVYSPNVRGGGENIPAPRYGVDISFGCAPKNVEKLIAVTMSEIQKLKQNGADPKDIEKYKIEAKRSNELKLKENGFWMGYLTGQYETGADLKEIFGENARVDSVSPSSTKAAANQYFGENMIRFVLLPEKK